MINLDQVRTLEWKVKQAVQLIAQLRRENDTLKGRLTDTEVRLRELETLLDAVKASQSEMEAGIQNALVELDLLEEDEPSLQRQDSSSRPAAAPNAEIPMAPSLVSQASEVPVETEAVLADSASIPAEDDADAAFEAEFAALAAAEAASLEDEASSVIEMPVPASVELETPEEAPSAEKAEAEQPGLGIF